MSTRVRLVGVGSPFGDDAVGWIVAREAARCLGAAVEIRLRDRPGLWLLEDLDCPGGVVLVDGVRGLGPPGTVAVLGSGTLPAGRLRLGSSHGFGVAEAVELARRLGRGPASLALVGIEIGESGEGGVRAVVRAAVPAAVRAVLRAVADVARPDPRRA